MQLNQHNSTLYILSAMHTENTPAYNELRHTQLRETLYSHAGATNISECEGRYKGEVEKSFIVAGAKRFTIHHLASIHRQECFLELEPSLNNTYKAYSVDVGTGQRELLGYFRSIDGELVGSSDYTRDSKGTYFVITPAPGVLDYKPVNYMELDHDL